MRVAGEVHWIHYTRDLPLSNIRANIVSFSFVRVRLNGGWWTICFVKNLSLNRGNHWLNRFEAANSKRLTWQNLQDLLISRRSKYKNITTWSTNHVVWTMCPPTFKVIQLLSWNGLEVKFLNLSSSPSLGWLSANRRDMYLVSAAVRVHVSTLRFYSKECSKWYTYKSNKY